MAGEIPPTSACSVRITGRVQGVGFRAWAATEARRRAVSGWVRNAGDGSVEALLAGPRDRVEGMVAALREGPKAAQVTGIETHETETDDAPSPFEIRR